MELKIIEQLLEKYLEAETSVAEEGKLKQYFSSGNVAPHLHQYLPLFCYLGEAKKEQRDKPLALTLPVKPKKRKNRVYSWITVAASIVLFLVLVLQKEQKVSDFGTYEDPELAMQKTREALEMMSFYMNSGTQDLSYIQEFNDTKNRFLK